MVSFPSSSVGFLGFHPYMRLFLFRKLFVTCSCYFCCCCLFLVLLFRNGKREGRWEGRPRGRCMVYKVDNVHIQLRIIIKFPENPSITLFFLSIWGFRSPSKVSSLIKPKSKAHGFQLGFKSPAHFVWATIGFTEKLSVDCHHKGHIVRHHYSNSLMVSSCHLTPQCRDLRR